MLLNKITIWTDGENNKELIMYKLGTVAEYNSLQLPIRDCTKNSVKGKSTGG